MQWFGAIGGGAFILATLFMGVRLLLLARRTRALPELAMGLGLLLMGGLSYPLNVAARMSVELAPGGRVALMLVSQAIMIAGCVAIGVFNWRVFRPEARWPLALLLGFSLASVGFVIVQSLTLGFFAFVDAREGVYRFAIVAHGVPYCWGFLESFLYHRKLRRRLALGLADPRITRRVGLWAVTTGASTAINWFMIGLEIFDVDSATSPLAGAVLGPFGLVAAVALWLAFSAPGAARPLAEPGAPSAL